MSVEIAGEEFAERRRSLLEKVGSQAVALVAAAPEHIRNRDAHYPYRQDSDFQYLTGFVEPEAVLLLVPGRADGEVILFCRDRDVTREIWDGRRAGPEGAVRDFGADEAFAIDELDTRLPGFLTGRERVYHTLGEREEFDQFLLQSLHELRSKNRSGVAVPTEVVALDPLLHEMRLLKSSGEVAMMQQAATVSAAAHRRAIRFCQPGVMEYQLAAEIHHEFEYNGMTPAYSSIVGGGANGCILHYVENSEALRDGELVLIDAGGEHACYAADITRTFPVNGRFSAAQKAVYEVVLAAQLAAIEQVRAGQSWNAPHEAAVQVLVEGLVELGLLKGRVDDLIESEAYRRFYMHNTGHWLGLDVHDVGAYKLKEQWRELQPGMVLTVEPGLYIAAADDIDPQFHNIGIRIEDDVLVTEAEPRVLTAEAPKTVADIEQLMAG